MISNTCRSLKHKHFELVAREFATLAQTKRFTHLDVQCCHWPCFLSPVSDSSTMTPSLIITQSNLFVSNFLARPIIAWFLSSSYDSQLVIEEILSLVPIFCDLAVFPKNSIVYFIQWILSSLSSQCFDSSCLIPSFD